MVRLAVMRGLPIALASLALLWACQPPANTLTIAIALLPSELPAYRAVLADFERDSGLRVVVVPQQYVDIRRALAAVARSIWCNSTSTRSPPRPEM